MTREYHARVHQEDDAFWAEVIELPGCYAAGDNMQELQESLAEAMSLVLNADVQLKFGDPYHEQRTEDREILVSF